MKSSRLPLLFLLLVVLLLCAGSTIYASQVPVNVFIVPHSHCDVGWLKTIDEYYYETVKTILDNTVEALMKDRARKFIWVETAFFYKWWKAATNTQRQQFRYLLTKTQQIEFIIGGFVMNDEALCTYSSIIDQMTLGHSFLVNEFGEFGVPRVGWQIDPFGASGIQTTLSKLMDFEYTVTNRIDYQLKAQYKKEKFLQFMWEGSANLGQKSRIFSHVLDSHYSAPPSFNWQRPYESPAITPQNVEARAGKLVAILRERASWFATNNILVPFGDDFEFTWAEYMFGNMTRLIDHINARPELGFKLQFATLSEYFDAVIKAKPVNEWPVYRGDFQPYADNANSFWTGYFTSVPKVKEAARQAERQARTCETLFSIARVERNIDRWSSFEKLYNLRIAYANVQHHDGITGTEREHVTKMYIDDIDAATVDSDQVAAQALSVLMQRDADQKKSLPISRDVHIISMLNSGDTAPLVLYNNLGWERREVVSIPVNRSDLEVTDESGFVISSQFNTPCLDSKSKYVMSFVAILPPLGYRSYFISPVTNRQRNSLINKEEYIPQQTNEDLIITNENYEIQICQPTGRLCRIKNRLENLNINVDQQFMAYNSFFDGRKGQTSGAYIFRPLQQTAFPITTSAPRVTVERGPEFDQIVQVFANDAVQVIRLYKNDPSFVEFELLVGPLEGNKEFISRFSTSIANNREVYTEQNGLEKIKRSFIKGTEQPVATNYNVMQYAAFIKDENAQLTVLTDRSHGVASLENGQIEFMMHRRTLQDDGRGLDRPLNDTSVIRPKMRLTLTSPKSSAPLRHTHTYLLNFPVEVFAVQQMVASPRNFTQVYRTHYSPLRQALPPNLHLATLQAYDRDSTRNIIRFVNVFENDEINSVPRYNETLQVNQLFGRYNLLEWMETNLSTSRVHSKGTGSLQVALPPINFKTFLMEFGQN